MVGAVVPEPKLERLRAEREPEDLVTEADAEHGNLAEEAGGGVGRAGDRSRVAGAIGQEHAVGPAGEHVGGGRRGRHDLDEAAYAGKVAQDRRLDAEVVRGDVEHGVGITGGVRLLGGDAGDEVAAVGRRRRGRRRAHDGLVGAERARQRAGFAEVTREPAGVDPGDAGHVMATQEVVQALGGAPVAGAARQVADQDTGAERPTALDVVGVHAVVPDVRVREGDHLPGVGRVGEDLLVTRERGVEHDLASRGSRLGNVADGHERHAGASARSSTPGSTSSLNVSANAVSRPSIPGGASSNGRSLASGTWGAWSVAMASMVPSASPAFTAATSASVRRGGWTLNAGANVWHSASVSVKWCGATSAVTGTPRSLASRTMSTAAAVDRWRKWTGVPVSSASRTSRATTAASAASGRPGIPRRLGPAPSCMWPSAAGDGSSAGSAAHAPASGRAESRARRTAPAPATHAPSSCNIPA